MNNHMYNNTGSTARYPSHPITTNQRMNLHHNDGSRGLGSFQSNYHGSSGQPTYSHLLHVISTPRDSSFVSSMQNVGLFGSTAYNTSLINQPQYRQQSRGTCMYQSGSTSANSTTRPNYGYGYPTVNSIYRYTPAFLECNVPDFRASHTTLQPTMGNGNMQSQQLGGYHINDNSHPLTAGVSVNTNMSTSHSFDSNTHNTQSQQLGYNINSNSHSLTADVSGNTNTSSSQSFDANTQNIDPQVQRSSLKMSTKRNRPDSHPYLPRTKSNGAQSTYSCKDCGAQFTSKKDLVTHRKQLHVVARKCCAVCGKTFEDGPSLTKHSRTHTGERPFKCDQCGLAFSQISNMHRHKRRAHAGKSKNATTINDSSASC